MEKKRWGLIYSGLCLALVFSVSSVEAANQCEPCERCDQDGDTFIKDSQPCRNKCGSANLDPNDTDPLIPGGAFAACTVGEDGDIALYTVELTGDVTSDSAAWRGSASDSSKTISLPVFNPGGMMLDLSTLVTDNAELTTTCFPGAGMTLLRAAQINSKNVRGPDDEAIGMFWFDGKNDDATIDAIDVGYVLQMIGTFLNDDLWPGDNIVTFLEWKMQVESTTKGGRKSACTSEGTFNTNITATVIQTND